ncbi:glycosyltransferase family 2 protein [Cupriavidus consociatus]|uniref:glycosyltransferase family 2 protein n=1 Tax=Cupriavidus consociatus TaxID=2821357 RepID=UPI001FD757BF|nr:MULTISPECIES: glycosyltransferase family 2 protein [unclassified Cupriavidus]MDK2658127.1 glycosyltransferase family 2 protein [Cupriavidus sp. LEh21]
MNQDSGMAPTISILLPAWNAEQTLALALRSLLAQTFRDFEVLVLDDGSADGTVAVAKGIADPRVRVIEDGRRLGLARRLNLGIDMARGRYIARMDADDVSFPERFARQVGFLDAHPDVDLVGCRAVAFRSDGEILGLLPFAGSHEAMCARPWRGIPLPHPGWMGRREWFIRYHYGLPEVMRAEDQELLLRSHAESRFACLEEVLLGYRQGSFNLRKTLLARRSLLAAQLRYFVGQRQMSYALGALALTAARVAVDVLASLPRADRLYFVRMSERPPSEAVRILRSSLDRCDALSRA